MRIAGRRRARRGGAGVVARLAMRRRGDGAQAVAAQAILEAGSGGRQRQLCCSSPHSSRATAYTRTARRTARRQGVGALRWRMMKARSWNDALGGMGRDRRRSGGWSACRFRISSAVSRHSTPDVGLDLLDAVAPAITLATCGAPPATRTPVPAANGRAPRRRLQLVDDASVRGVA